MVHLRSGIHIDSDASSPRREPDGPDPWIWGIKSGSTSVKLPPFNPTGRRSCLPDSRPGEKGWAEWLRSRDGKEKPYREIWEGQGRVFPLEDRKAFSAIGTDGLFSCVGIYYQVNMTECFIAHILPAGSNIERFEQGEAKRSSAIFISEERGRAKKVTEQLAAHGRPQRRYLDTLVIVVGSTGYAVTQPVPYGIVDWAGSCGITESEHLGRMQVGRTAFVVRNPGEGDPYHVWFKRVPSGDSERDLDILHPEEIRTSGHLLSGARGFGIAAESKDFEWTSREGKYGSFTREERQFFGMRPGETIRLVEPPPPGF